MKSLRAKAYAKINLTLDITGKREDGYHLLQSIMQSISLYDLVSIAQTDSNDIQITCDTPGIPCDRRNIAYKAAEEFFAHTGIACSGLKIDLQKKIPSQAGLGGGSADAAAVLVMLNQMFDSDLSAGTLCQIGQKIGADVPFCIRGGCALAEGIGEILTPLPRLQDCSMVLIKPPFGIDTAQAYRAFDAADVLERPDTQTVVSSLQNEDLGMTCVSLCNVLESAVNHPDITQIKQSLFQLNALGCCMTGSGSAVFGIFANRFYALACREALRQYDWEIYLVHPIRQGIEILPEEEDIL